ncbi:hypothetical protein UYSO10_4964 [Kosakonia radicincitans]|uniref:prophage tail fiber N-terminal domain-containing protein n=1 Tax=Kosakonia radicincitans TaxID=283686 RepID=UPI001183F60D|nr:prophage tail fiber N-terminal domain-containing protein [Kosakonia radicincitans]VVT53942.1 hypothetical protein UYSO10_4964 [Kosakonia radicincitans]
MTILSGIFRRPDGVIVAGVAIRFTLLINTASSFIRQVVDITTGQDGSYSVELSSGTYTVETFDKSVRAYLGTISVFSDSDDGPLNEFLIASSAAGLNPVVDFVQSSLSEMIQLQQTPAKSVAVYADIPSDASGWYLVASDETKGGAPVVYLFAGGKRYWFAMVEDA